MDTPDFIYSSTDRHLSCLYFLTIMNYPALNISIQVSVWTFAFISPGYILKSRSFRSHDNSMFTILKKIPDFLPRWLYHFTTLSVVYESPTSK